LRIRINHQASRNYSEVVKMVTKYAKKNICGNSHKVDKINDGKFDIFFYTVGWESRFTEILNHLGDSFNSEQNIVCYFKQEGESGYSTEEKSKFIDALNAYIGAEVESLEFEYSKFEAFDDKINQIINSALKIKKRPLKIGFEISSCPRYYFLSFLGLCISKNYINNLSFFYSEGEYPDINDDDSFFNSFGTNTKIIPYSGLTEKEGRTVLIFSLGFESNFIIDKIIKCEPSHIIFLCANPGYTRKYEVKVDKEIERIITFCELPDHMYTLKYAPAGDTISAWQELEKNIADIEDAHAINYAIGTKPHCIAMTLNGLVNDNIVVKYRIAKKYNKRDVKSNGEYWRYDITNLSVI